jgi:hypothetical protein
VNEWEHLAVPVCSEAILKELADLRIQLQQLPTMFNG